MNAMQSSYAGIGITIAHTTIIAAGLHLMMQAAEKRKPCEDCKDKIRYGSLRPQATNDRQIRVFNSRRL